MSFNLLPPYEQQQINGLAHLQISDRGRMNAVSAIVRRVDKIRVRWAADDLVEVKDAVESRLRTDPIVDLIADLRLRIVPAGVVRNSSDAVPRNDRGANHINALRFEPG